MDPPTSKSGYDVDYPFKQEERPERMSPPPRPPPTQPPTPASPAHSINSLSTLRSRRWHKATAIGASVVVGLGVAATVVWVVAERTKPPKAIIQDVFQSTEYSINPYSNNTEYLQAKDLCEAAGLTLAMARDDREAAELENFLNLNNELEFGFLALIGLDDLGDDEGTYKWNDNSAFHKTSLFGEPVGNTETLDCVVIRYLNDTATWGLAAQNCTLKLPYICQTKVPPITTPTTTPTTTTTTIFTSASTSTTTTTTTPETTTGDNTDTIALVAAAVGVVVLLLVVYGAYKYDKKRKEKTEKQQRKALEKLEKIEKARKKDAKKKPR